MLENFWKQFRVAMAPLPNTGYGRDEAKPIKGGSSTEIWEGGDCSPLPHAGYGSDCIDCKIIRTLLKRTLLIATVYSNNLTCY